MPGRTEPRRFLFLLASTRRGGNTERLTRLAADALPETDSQTWLRLSDLAMPAFVDSRHVGDGVYPAPTGACLKLLDATLDATDLVFAAPLYWYGLPAAAKLYLDHWSGWMRVAGLDFKPRMAGKIMWSVTAFSDSDVAMVDPLLGTLRLSAAYMGMRWGGSLIGYGNRPGDIEADIQALDQARTFFSGGPACA